MPASRRPLKQSPTTAKVIANGKKAAKKLPVNELAKTLLAGAAWEALLELLDAQDEDSLTGADVKGAYCRAFVHASSPNQINIDRAKKYSTELLISDAAQVDALLCSSLLAKLEGKHKIASDQALAALKASDFKDKDALELLQGSYSKQHEENKGDEDKEDYYATLCVARTAPQSVIQAAHTALGHPLGSPEAAVADEALSVLSDPERRKAYDAELGRHGKGGGGRDFEGGSELLKQLGEALGLVFPEGFVFPPSGRFQGGFGGGFEYTWGEK